MNGPQYSLVDRMLHRFAFASPAVQDMLANIELSMWPDAIEAQQIDRPVFVCSLPRAGTTLVLQLLAQHPDCVSQTYRDMPFMRAPVLWRKLSRQFWTEAVAAERAHGDGMAFDADSVEAFEEVVWLRYFPELFTEAGIEPLRDGGDTLRRELGMHVRRVLAAAGRSDEKAARYVSKNNANVSRVEAILSAFPDARLIVPIRHPLEHARSLHRQYGNFLAMHGQDAFALRYMRDLGHFEFGRLHRPIRFPGIAEMAGRHEPRQLEYWIEYWRLSFQDLAQRDGLHFVDYGRLHVPGSIEALFEAAALPANAAAVEAARNLVRQPGAKTGERPDSQSARDAVRLYEELRSAKACVNRPEAPALSA